MSEIKYEDALKRLEKLVSELDRSELELDARLKKFEEGTKLTRTLLKRLEQAKKKVETLIKTNNLGETALSETELSELDEEETDGDDAEERPSF